MTEPIIPDEHDAPSEDIGEPVEIDYETGEIRWAADGAPAGWLEDAALQNAAMADPVDRPPVLDPETDRAAEEGPWPSRP